MPVLPAGRRLARLRPDREARAHRLTDDMLHVDRFALPDERAVAGCDVRGGGPGTRETDALAPENLVSHVEELVEDTAAGLDYQLKRQVQRVDEMLTGLTKG